MIKKLIAGACLLTVAPMANALTTITVSGYLIESSVAGTGDRFTAAISFDENAQPDLNVMSDGTIYANYRHLFSFVSVRSGSFYTEFNWPDIDGSIGSFIGADGSRQFQQYVFNNIADRDVILDFFNLNTGFAADLSLANLMFLTDPDANNEDGPLDYYYAAFEYDLLGDNGDSTEFDGSIDTVSVAVTSDVPEPASWAMMIGGFGLIGGAMRRQKVVFAIN